MASVLTPLHYVRYVPCVLLSREESSPLSPVGSGRSRAGCGSFLFRDKLRLRIESDAVRSVCRGEREYNPGKIAQSRLGAGLLAVYCVLHDYACYRCYERLNACLLGPCYVRLSISHSLVPPLKLDGTLHSYSYSISILAVSTWRHRHHHHHQQQQQQSNTIDCSRCRVSYHTFCITVQVNVYADVFDINCWSPISCTTTTDGRTTKQSCDQNIAASHTIGC